MWSELPTDLLESICKRVGVIEYLMCACVCKSWRSAANSFRQRFMASQGPLVFLMPRHAINHGYFYDMFDKRRYRAALPHLRGNRCLGFTCGYLVLSGMKENRAKIWLVNPFTRHELEFPSPPNLFSHVILASLANSDGEFLVVAFSRVFPYLQFRRSGDVNWISFDCNNIPGTIVDVAVFKGKIYALSSDGEIWTLNLTDPPLKIPRVRSVAACLFNLHLVASHEGLYIAHIHPAEDLIEIHKLDFQRMQWEEVKLQGEVLFLGDLKCCGLSFPTPSWCCSSEHMNQVCYLRDDQTAVFVSATLKCQMDAIPEDWTLPMIRSSIWYFPHLSSSVDSVYED